MKRAENQKSWLYKVRPSTIEGQYQLSEKPHKIISSYMIEENLKINPSPIRWKPIADVKENEKKDFV